ncbi:zinc finger protein 585B-like [Prorops nasuta]|uniref:zinc finger protein 585B-like n=1 Tax=Prorops nasuta TaxID=863751 RepID=UPI0034CE2DD1
MEPYDEDEDTHFCIKCHTTVHGLENYVRHRQAGCQSSEKAVVELPPTPTTVSYPEILNADAFFSSLELQSSSKSNARKPTTSLEDSTKRRDGRRRRNRKCKEKLSESNVLPGVADLDPTENLCIPTLEGFQDIVTSNKSASTSTGKLGLEQTTSKIETGFPAKNEAEASLESLIEDSKQGEAKRQEETQRLDQDHQIWLEDTILADLVDNNETKLSRYEFGYQDDDEDSGEDDMLNADLPEEDSYSDSDDVQEPKFPPKDHTGGKWKPGQSDLGRNLPDLPEDEAEPEEDQDEHPPPSYTGGKWKPTESLQKIEEYRCEDRVQPPPSHTRGKWVPGAKEDIKSGYWCNPCGRKLASRLVYNRHLLSDLHARRSMRDLEGVLDLPRTSNIISNRSTTRRRATKTKNAEGKEDKVEGKKGVRLRKRDKKVVSCEMCHARVRRPQMGKHLLSHYHCRVAGTNPYGSRARRFLLENMANVVRQCPFQCSPCRFYCNTEQQFLLHWRSSPHVTTFQQGSGSYRCRPCDFCCDGDETMESHLLSTSHKDVVSMMNGSVPVVISRERDVSCTTCEQRFRYNLQLRLHAKGTGHELSLTATDEYQKRFTCTNCSQIIRSLISLQRHQIKCRVSSGKAQGSTKNMRPYFCSFCSIRFSTAKEAMLHRRTSDHKERRRTFHLSTSENLEASKPIVRQCPHCGEKRDSLDEYKEHLLEQHPQLCHRCAKCGKLFALSQDVTKHTKYKECSQEEEGEGEVVGSNVGKKRWLCSSCSFSSDSQAEFLFHQALHTGRLPIDKDEPSSSKSIEKYRCPVCDKTLPKASLRNHLRNHTGERPFPCVKCSTSFSRRSELNAHLKNCTGSPLAEKFSRRRTFSCARCTSSFYTKYALWQHMQRHEGKKFKCGLPGCPTILRTAAELKTHRRLVHESSDSDRKFSCTECSYSAKTKTQLHRHSLRHIAQDTGKPRTQACPHEGCGFKTKLGSHLRRHMRLHTGTKPYKCRHCAYASNNLENLRKHVLSTGLHPGKTIYECDICHGKQTEAFSTNFAKELRAHLQEAHSDKFPTPSQASTYVLKIFEDPRD